MWTIAIFLALSSLFGLSAASCTMDDVNNCMQPFTSKYGQVGLGESMDFEVDDMCVDYQTMRSCFDVFESSCEQPILIAFQGVDNAMGYLCGSGKARYEANKDCIKGILPTNKGLLSCTNSFQTDFAKLQQDIVQASTTSEQEKLKNDACIMIGNMFDCTTDVVQDECNADAAGWFRNFIDEMMKPYQTMLTMSCSFTGGAESVKGLGVFVVSLAVGLLLAML